jgi:cytochrome bd-type quinol oxidase subunit 1
VATLVARDVNDAMVESSGAWQSLNLAEVWSQAVKFYASVFGRFLASVVVNKFFTFNLLYKGIL